MQKQLIAQEDFSLLTKSEMSEVYSNTLNLINELYAQIEQLEQSAIDLIVEKDQIIEQLELQVNHSSRRASCSNYEEVQQYKNHINELQIKIEQIQNKHFEQLKEQEKLWNQYLLNELSQNQQNIDEKLKNHLDQIFQLEEKINTLEHQLDVKENQQIIFTNQKKFLIDENSKLQDNQMMLNREILKLQIQIEQLQDQTNIEKGQLRNQLIVASQQVNDLQQSSSSLKVQNQKLSNQNKIYTNTISELILKKTELEQMLQSSIEKYNSTTLKTSINEQYTDLISVREDINTTAFDFNEETTDLKQEMISFQIEDTNNKCNQSEISKVSEKQYDLKFIDLEKQILISTKIIKQQNAQVQLLTQQIKVIKKLNNNQQNFKDYIKIIEQNCTDQIQLKSNQINSLQQKINILNQENSHYKSKVKQYSQKLLKYYNKKQIKQE